MEKKKLDKRKRVIYNFISDDLYVPMKTKEIAILLHVEKDKRDELQEVLDALVEDGSIELSGKGKYFKAASKKKRAKKTLQSEDKEKAERGTDRDTGKKNGENSAIDDKNRFDELTGEPLVTMTGVFTGNARGFGFVTVEDQEEDLFIPGEYTNGAMHMDTVEIALQPQRADGKRQEARIVKIIARGMTQIVGTYESSNGYGFVVADNQKIAQDIFVPKERSNGAISGHKVVVEITKYSEKGKKPEGKVVEIIGHINDPGTDIMAIVRGYELPVEFDAKQLKQAETVSKDVDDADMAGRMDLRDVQMVTIDSEEAKDLDDAVSLVMDGDNYILGVHIADVANYVQEHSALDEEAVKRGTSVYLVDRVIPMLPHRLSNGICSLNEGENRLALSCIMTIDKKGNVVDHTIAESVIKVDRRMSYNSVKKILVDKDKEEIAEYKKLVPMFKKMSKLADILRKKRMKRGSIDFDFPETKIILDEQGRPIAIKPYDRNVATKMIEDFMLIANETVAQDFFWKEIPFVYRTHETPDDEKIQKLATLIGNFGYTLNQSKDEIQPKELQKLLANIEGTEEEPLISRITLRSMKQARYTTENTGHFGLATPYYCHFTSPIRRYPDLQIHRIIKEQLRGKMNAKRIDHYEKLLPEIAKHASEMERRSDEAERETEKLKKAQYMETHLGEVYEGVISSVTGWGMYVELPNTVEGLIHITALDDDYYVFSEDTYELIGETKNKHYKLGQKIKVMAVGIDKIVRTIDFALADENAAIGSMTDKDVVMRAANKVSRGRKPSGKGGANKGGSGKGGAGRGRGNAKRGGSSKRPGERKPAAKKAAPGRSTEPGKSVRRKKNSGVRSKKVSRD